MYFISAGTNRGNCYEGDYPTPADSEMSLFDVSGTTWRLWSSSCPYGNLYKQASEGLLGDWYDKYSIGKVVQGTMYDGTGPFSSTSSSSTSGDSNSSSTSSVSISSSSSSSSSSKSNSSSSTSGDSNSTSSSSLADRCSVYPPEQSGTYVKATSTYGDNTMLPYYATDPTKSLDGAWENNSWSSVALSYSNQKFNIDLGSAHTIIRFWIVNGHSSGSFTNAGVKNYIFYGTNEATAFANTTYATTTNLTQLKSGVIDEWTSNNGQYVDINSANSYRYYVFRFADNWGREWNMDIRRVELQEECEMSSSSTSGNSNSSSSSSSKSVSSSSSSTSQEYSESSSSSSKSVSSESSQSPSSQSTQSESSSSTSQEYSESSSSKSVSSESSQSQSSQSPSSQSTQSESSSSENVYELIGYLSCEINGSNTKDHYIPLYDHYKVGYTASNRDFWGDIVVFPTNLALSGYISMDINSTGSTYWMQVYTADPSLSCCTNLVGTFRGI